MSNIDPKYSHLFNPSGDLNDKAIWAFAHGQLSAEEGLVAEQHIAGCEFCRDAVDGAAAIKSELSWQGHLNTLNDSVHARTGIRKRRVLLMPQYQKLAVAAILVVLIGAAFIWFNKFGQNKSNGVAQKQEQPQTQPVIPTPVPVRADSVKPDTGTITVAAKAVVDTIPHPLAVIKEDVKEQKLKNKARLDETRVAESDDQAPDSLLLQMEARAMANAKPDTVSGKKNAAYAYTPPALDKEESAMPTTISASANKTAARNAKAQSFMATDKVAEGSEIAQPKYKGGEAGVQKYIDSVATTRENFRPTQHQVELTIDEKGTVININFFKKRLNNDEQEIRDALMAMPAWKPAYNNGLPEKASVLLNLEY